MSCRDRCIWGGSRAWTSTCAARPPVATGVGAFGFFYACALVARRVPALDRAIGNVLQFAKEGQGPLVVATTLANALGEEIFFRGAMYAALAPDHAVVASTTAYALTTASTRNPALMLAAGVTGTLFGLQRRAFGGLQAPVLTHLTWSTLMVRSLPPLFRHTRDGRAGAATTWSSAAALRVA